MCSEHVQRVYLNNRLRRHPPLPPDVRVCLFGLHEARVPRLRSIYMGHTYYKVVRGDCPHNGCDRTRARLKSNAQTVISICPRSAFGDMRSGTSTWSRASVRLFSVCGCIVVHTHAANQITRFLHTLIQIINEDAVFLFVFSRSMFVLIFE